jgi:hypothetical protein
MHGAGVQLQLRGMPMHELGHVVLLLDLVVELARLDLCACADTEGDGGGDGDDQRQREREGDKEEGVNRAVRGR